MPPRDWKLLEIGILGNCVPNGLNELNPLAHAEALRLVQEF